MKAYFQAILKEDPDKKFYPVTMISWTPKGRILQVEIKTKQGRFYKKPDDVDLIIFKG